MEPANGREATTVPPTTQKRRGRPPLAHGEGRSARVEWRTTQARKARAQRLADAAGLTLAAWLDQLVDAAR